MHRQQQTLGLACDRSALGRLEWDDSGQAASVSRESCSEGFVMNFMQYGAGGRNVSLASLIEESSKEGLLVARAEYSGCEGCYIEVAKWNTGSQRYERYAFEKVFGGEHPSEDGEAGREVSAAKTAQLFCNDINGAGSGVDDYMPIVHSMPNYAECATQGVAPDHEEYEDLDQDYPQETAEKLLADSSISHWLRNALVSALDRDCVDAANDAECLAAVLKARCETAAASV